MHNSSAPQKISSHVSMAEAGDSIFGFAGAGSSEKSR